MRLKCMVLRAGNRKRQAVSTSTRRMCPLPFLEIPPWRRRLPEECSLGTSPGKLISRRYERGPMIPTDQGFGAWEDVFGHRVIVTAIFDRVLHHAVTVNMKR